MLVFGTNPETLPVSIKTDPTSGLPLLGEQDAIMQFILAYLALPYSVTEFGCGKKASLIIDQLLALKIPPFALARILILERDLSPTALAQTDFRDRPHALVANNLLHEIADPDDSRLKQMVADALPEATLTADGSVQAGPYVLRAHERVQFESSRSHVSTLVTFWDDENSRCIQKILDPSLNADRIFNADQLRDCLRAPEALIFAAPLLGHFRLHPGFLTRTQAEEFGERETLESLTFEEEAALVRELTGAEEGSIGDPTTWTYANNLSPVDDEATTDHNHFRQQVLDTGKGDAYRQASHRLRVARSEYSEDTSAILASLRGIDEEIEVYRRCHEDARWSATYLQPLADVATLFISFRGLRNLAHRLRKGDSILDALEDNRALQELRGLGVRLRRRIEWLAEKSTREDGSIDARALSEGFVAATLETIRQMNRAGLTVFIDRVGNVHGLLASGEERDRLRSGALAPEKFCRNSIWHGSHIDTVNDAGKFDGRLGVLSGIETANILYNLERYFDLPISTLSKGVHTHVTAFIGEEMTFTGQGVSMPGSAAISSRAKVEDVHEMVNGNGEKFGALLKDMLAVLRGEQQAGNIELVNDLAASEETDLIAACSDPVGFYSRHSFERHIEQGPVLDRAGVPIVMVGTIMGIHQEDFFFSGDRAEEAALEMNSRLRDLTRKSAFSDVRITVGIMENCGEGSINESVDPASRWTLQGEMNHAGATPTPDRCDPGVAAARLAGEFRKWCKESLPDDLRDRVRASVSNVRLLPGTNRNVIPATAALTLALETDADEARSQLNERLREDMNKSLEAFVVGTLSRKVSGGGEGIQLTRLEPISYTTRFSRSRLTIDLRADSEKTMAQFRKEIDTMLEELECQFDVRIDAELQQQVAPSHLEESGQALLMERSYGGSHNPRETELLSDIVRGTVLQVAVTRDALQLQSLDECNLFSFVEDRMPAGWLKTMNRFTSGALHDTCNIAARAKQELKRQAA